MKKILKILVIIIFTFLCIPISQAEVDLVTIPVRDMVQLTIYNSEDITYVKENREIIFKKGINEIEFSWANTLIDPTSVDFRLLTGQDKLEVLDTTYPANRTEALIWHIQAEESGPQKVEVSYFTSGLTWTADYVGITDNIEEKMLCKGYVRVYNNSGEEYENAQVRVVVGKIHLVEQIRDLANPHVFSRGAKARMSEAILLYERCEGEMGSGDSRADYNEKKIIKEGLSEYFVYTIEGTETIPNGWSKRLKSFEVNDIALEAEYRYDDQKYGQQLLKFLICKNDKEHNLGKEPLPNGAFWIFRENEGNLFYLGKQNMEYIPVGEDIELNLGGDLEVTYEQKLMDFKKDEIHFDQYNYVDGWNTYETYETEIKNCRDKAVNFDIKVSFKDYFELISKQDHEKYDMDTVRFKFKIEPHSNLKFPYTVITKNGFNSVYNVGTKK